jgi:hypothetical protein
MIANVCASRASLFVPNNVWRSRYRATCNGSIARRRVSRPRLALATRRHLIVVATTRSKSTSSSAGATTPPAIHKRRRVRRRHRTPFPRPPNRPQTPRRGHPRKNVADSTQGGCQRNMQAGISPPGPDILNAEDPGAAATPRRTSPGFDFDHPHMGSIRDRTEYAAAGTEGAARRPQALLLDVELPSRRRCPRFPCRTPRAPCCRPIPSTSSCTQD